MLISKEHGREPACSRESRLDAVARSVNPIARENGTAPPPYDSYMVRGDGCLGTRSGCIPTQINDFGLKDGGQHLFNLINLIYSEELTI